MIVEAGLSPDSVCRLAAFRKRVYECLRWKANAPSPSDFLRRSELSETQRTREGRSADILPLAKAKKPSKATATPKTRPVPGKGRNCISAATMRTTAV